MRMHGYGRTKRNNKEARTFADCVDSGPALVVIEYTINPNAGPERSEGPDLFIASTIVC